MATRTAGIDDIGYAGEVAIDGVSRLAADTAWVWIPLDPELGRDDQEAVEVCGDLRLVEMDLAEAFELVDAVDVRLTPALKGAA